jgi:peptidoglycan/LPS O-acetylase OafA/YrhL
MASAINSRFPNLDGLRFLASIFVVINHTEQISGILGLDNYFSLRGIEQIGKFGVMLFFSLSGFLITYLLIKEKEVTGSINIKAFYLRRILRIWPLYILIVLMAFFFFHYIPLFDLNNGVKSIFFDNLGLKLLFYLVMLPNLVLIVFGGIPYASQTWSIGSEEQFYVIWPVILKWMRITIISLLCIILFYHIFLYFFQNYVRSNIYREYCIALIQTVPIDLMALGGIVAVIVYHKNYAFQILDRIFNQMWFRGILIVVLFFLMLTGYRFPQFNYLFYGVIMSALIFLLTRGNSYKILESRWLTFGGKISYGIYMWHAPIVTMVLKFLMLLGIQSKILSYPLILLVTIFTAWLSFRFLETPFLRLKKNYTIIT